MTVLPDEDKEDVNETDSWYEVEEDDLYTYIVCVHGAASCLFWVAFFPAQLAMYTGFHGSFQLQT